VVGHQLSGGGDQPLEQRAAESAGGVGERLVYERCSG